MYVAQPNGDRGLMATTTRRPLTRDRIVAAAIEMADVDGIGSLTMRGLAAHLGFEVMSLYNHVANKEDLLDAMVDVVAGEIEEPTPDVPWRPAARTIALSAHGVLLNHRWASPLWSTRWPGPNRWRHMETLLRAIGEAGLTEELTDLGFHAITLHIQGFAQQQLDYASMAVPDDELYARFGADVDEGRPSARVRPHALSPPPRARP